MTETAPHSPATDGIRPSFAIVASPEESPGTTDTSLMPVMLPYPSAA